MVANTLLPGQPWKDRRVLTRGGTQGDLAVKYEAGANGELIIVAGRVNNADTVARSAEVRLLDKATDDTLTLLNNNGALGVGGDLQFPIAASSHWNNGMPLVIGAGDAYLQSKVSSVAATEDAKFSILGRYTGAAPTVTEVNA